MEYNKEKINNLTVTFLETGEGFEDLLRELEKMCWKVIQRHPKYKAYWEDLKQEMLIKVWQCLLNKPDKLRKSVANHIPADYFFFRLRGYALQVIPTVDPSFDPKHPYLSKHNPKHPSNKNLSNAELRAKFLDRPSSGYDSLDDDVIGFAEMSTKEKRKVFSDIGENDNEED